MDWARGLLSSRKILSLIDLFPDPSIFYAQVAANHPEAQGDSGKSVPGWRRYYGWGLDRMIAHSAVAVHLDQKGQDAWSKVIPAAKPKTMTMAEAMVRT